MPHKLLCDFSNSLVQGSSTLLRFIMDALWIVKKGVCRCVSACVCVCVCSQCCIEWSINGAMKVDAVSKRFLFGNSAGCECEL